MLSYQRGDCSAFETLYQRHKRAVYAFLLRSSAHPDSVEEIFQEAWTAIIRNIQAYEPKAKFKTYLYQVAHNKLVDYWRRRKHEVPVEDEQSMDAEVGPAESSSSAPEDAVLHDQVLQMLAQLPAEQRCAFLLRHLGFSQQEIAEISGVGTETVKSRLRYATNSVRQALNSDTVHP